MTNLPAEISPFPSSNDWGMMQQQASLLVKSGFLPPTVKSPEAALAIMMKGRELGIPAMESFDSISVIKGKPTISPELMLKLIFRAFPKTQIDYKTLTNEKCEIEVTRPGNRPQTFCFSMEDAKQAKLTGKDNWRNYTRAMLRSRCISEMARSLFPDAISGCSYTPEEMGAATNEDQTEVITIAQPAEKMAKPGDIQLMFSAWKQTGLDMDELRGYLKEKYGVSNTRDMTTGQCIETVSWIKATIARDEKGPEFIEPDIEEDNEHSHRTRKSPEQDHRDAESPA